MAGKEFVEPKIVELIEREIEKEEKHMNLQEAVSQIRKDTDGIQLRQISGDKRTFEALNIIYGAVFRGADVIKRDDVDNAK